MSDILLSNKQKKLCDDVFNTVSNEILHYYKLHQDKSFCIYLSGGYDSRYLLYTCIQNNIKISRCYSYCMDGIISSDCKLARLVCEKENIPFTLVPISLEPSSIISTFELLAKNYKCTKKTDFECSLPLYNLYQNTKEDVILMATDSDNYFALDGNYGRHYSMLDDGLIKYKESLRAKVNDGQIIQKQLLNIEFGKLQFDVFRTDAVYNAFVDTTYNDVNKPHIKLPLYYKFKDKYDDIKPYMASYQCGDTQLRDICFKILMDSKYNKGYKSSTGCYNEIVRCAKSKDDKRKVLFKC